MFAGLYKVLYLNPDVLILSKFDPPVSFVGSYVCVLLLTIVKFLNGAVHVAIGGSLLFLESEINAYSIYTFLYGFFNLVLT